MTEWDRPELSERRLCVLHRIEGKGRLVSGEAALVGVSGILLLQMPGVPQQHLAEGGGRLGTHDRSVESVLDEQGEGTGMIEMGMGQDDRRNAGRLHRKFLPIHFSERPDSLKKTAVDENLMRRRMTAATLSSGCRRRRSRVFTILMARSLRSP
jgi:hypothetical protein